MPCPPSCSVTTACSVLVYDPLSACFASSSAVGSANQLFVFEMHAMLVLRLASCSDEHLRFLCDQLHLPQAITALRFLALPPLAVDPAPVRQF